jgi:hypothetical protein
MNAIRSKTYMYAMCSSPRIAENERMVRGGRQRDGSRCESHSRGESRLESRGESKGVKVAAIGDEEMREEVRAEVRAECRVQNGDRDACKKCQQTFGMVVG